MVCKRTEKRESSRSETSGVACKRTEKRESSTSETSGRPSLVCSQRSSDYLHDGRWVGLVPGHAYLELAFTLEENRPSHVFEGTGVGERKKNAVRINERQHTI